MSNLARCDSHRARARRLLALAAAAMTLLMGCAMPSDAEPEPITLDDEYANLLEPAPPPTTTTPAESTLPAGCGSSPTTCSRGSPPRSR